MISSQQNEPVWIVIYFIFFSSSFFVISSALKLKIHEDTLVMSKKLLSCRLDIQLS